MEIAKPKYGDILELTIESSGFEGTSIARHNGLVVFVEGAVAGDVVRAKVLRTKKKHVEAKVVGVLQPSPQRTTPRCEHFGICGGCKWQHVQYAAQLEFKRQHVVDALERIGGFHGVNVLPIVPSEDEYFYRNKLEFSFGNKPWLTENEKSTVILSEAKNLNVELTTDSSAVALTQQNTAFALGFHIPQRWDKILDINACHLQSEISSEILRTVRAFALENNLPAYSDEPQGGYFRNLMIREGKHTGDVMVNVVTFDDRPEVMEQLTVLLTKNFPEISTVINNITSRKANISTGEIEKVYYGDGVIREKLGSHVFHISANSFFQTNTKQTEKLYSLAKEFAELKPTDLVYDLYCGTGSISLYISDMVKQVVGIELVEDSIADAKMNAQINGISNCEFLCGDLKELLTKDTAWREKFSTPDVLIVDPPRSGMHPKAVEELGKMKVKRVVYVSCNPATLARDTQMLAKFGYSIEKVQPVDMFPHTYHIECVAKLKLQE